jgi:hypothetical protein
MESAMSEMYLIWSNEHGGWWMHGGYGYSTGLRGAGHFSREEAMKICRNALMTAPHLGGIAEFPVRLSDIQEMLRDQNVPEVVLRARNE